MNKTNRKIIVIALGVLIGLCIACIGFTFIMDAMGFIPTSTPTFAFTDTPLPTQTLISSQTPSAASTSTPLPTLTPYLTATLPPGCDLAYPDFCIPINTRPSCESLPKDFTVLPPDPQGYDGDGDGLGCES